jgi:hypothetical protein
MPRIFGRSAFISGISALHGLVPAVWTGGSSSKLVEELTETAGARVWSAASEDDLERLFTRALDEMRARYVLTFHAAAAGASRMARAVPSSPTF